MDSGAILTAVIAASAGTLAAVVAKDAKVSEFRQNWIDALREDVSRFSALVLALKRDLDEHTLIRAEPGKDKRISVDEARLELDGLAYRIILRLDLSPEKAELKNSHHALNRAVNHVSQMSQHPRIQEVDVRAAIGELNDKASALLDKAWDDVKDGEPRFRRAFRIAFTLTFLSIAVGVLHWLAVHQHLSPQFADWLR
jgi:hypothetical protein